MPRRTVIPLILSLTALLALPIIPARAAPDALEARWLAGVVMPISWTIREEKILLQPGEGYLMHLSANTLLRVEPLETPITPGDLLLTREDGSGLALERPWLPLEGGQLGAPPADGTGPRLLRLARPPEASTPLAFRIAVGEPALTASPPLYREEIPLPAPALTLLRPDPPSRHSVHRVEPGNPVEISLQGPLRLRVESHILWPDDAQGLFHHHRLGITLDQSPLPPWDILTALETDPVELVEAPNQELGTRESHHIDIPAGSHRLRFSSSETALLRLLARRDEDFLLTGLNAISIGPKEDPAHLRLLPRLGPTPPPDAQPLPVDKLLEAAHAMAHDPARPEGPLEAVAMLARSTAGEPLAGEDLLRAARRIQNRRTHFADLLPEPLPPAGVLPAYVPQRELLDHETSPWPPSFDPRHLPAALEMIPDALFAPLAGGESLTYPLPNRKTGRDLRLMVERPQGGDALPLEILFDQAPPLRALIAGRDRPDPMPARFRDSVGRSALLMMDPDDPWNVTARPAFARFRPPAPSLRAGALVIPLPTDVNRVTLRAPHGTPPLRVALQVRRPNPVTLTEAHYRAEVAHMGGDEALWRAFSSRTPLSPPLAGHLFPLERWLASQRQRFTSGIAHYSATSPGDKAAWQRQVVQARAAVAQEDWPSALWSWRRAIHAAPPQHREMAEAWTGLLRGLEAMGEPLIRERIQRGLLLQAKDRKLAALARRELVEDYRRQERDNRLLALLAWEADGDRSPARITALATALSDDSKERMALLAALLPPPEKRDHALTARLALKQGWIRTFRDAVARLSPEEAHLWRGWEGWSRGDEATARADWSQAGAEGAALLAALEQGQRLEHEGEAGSAEAARWWSAHPGPSGWVGLPGLMTRFHSAHVYVSATDGLPMTMALARPEAPAILEVAGPTRLRLELRPAQASGQDEPMTGWAILIPDAGEERRWALTDIPPAAGLLPLRPESPAPGIALEKVLTIPAGLHRISLHSPTLPLLLRAWVWRPDHPLALPRQGAAPTGSMVEETPAPLQRLENLLWMVEHHPAERAHALTEAETLFGSLAVTPQAVSLMRRLRHYSDWEQVGTVSASSGMRWVAMPHWQPDSPQGRTLAALLPPGPDDARLLSGHDRFVLSFNLMERKRILLGLELTAPPFTPLHPITAHVEVDGAPPKSFTLSSQRTTLQQPVALEPGERTLAVGLKDPVAGQMVRVTLMEENGVPIPWNIKRNLERLYHVATQAEPLVIQVKGPTVVRLDQWTEEGSRHRTVAVAPGWQTLTFTPPTGETSALYRVFQRQLLSQPPPRPLLPDNAPPPMPEPLPMSVTIPDAPPPAPLSWTGRATGPTWSFGLQRVERKDADDDDRASSKERFTEFSWIRRDHDPLEHLYDQQGVRIRYHDQGRPTLVGLAQWRHVDPRQGFNGRFSGDLFLQDVQGRGVEAAFTPRGGLSRLDRLDNRLDNLADGSAFVRLLTMKDSKGVDSRALDQDIFSSYRHDHRFGATLADTLIWRPWLDTNLSLRGGTTLNEDLNPFQPDNISLGTEWEQLMGDARFTLGYARRRYLADEHRRNPITRHGPTLTLSLDQWPGDKQDRLEWTLEFRREQSSGENTGMLGVTWHFDDNRLRNFSPGERPFQNLRIPAWPWPEDSSP